MRILLRFTFLIILSTVFKLSASAVTANFTADHVSGCAPLVVSYTNTSTGADRYEWDLGNGTTSPLTDVGGTYVTPGVYVCTLKAWSGGTFSIKTMTITVHPSPTVRFAASDTSVCPGSTVTFTNTSIPGVPGPMTCLWNFGDGGTSTLASPSHVFNTPGFYNITLSVTNGEGCTSSLTISRFIHVFDPPTASFSAVSPYLCRIPGHAVFNNTSTGTPGLTYRWSFGDGGTSTLPNPTHDYLTTGAFTVKLVVTDGNGCMDSIIRPAYINIGTLDANFTAPATACVGSLVTFTNTSSSHISSSWNFGDGGTSTLESDTHSYGAAGTYSVRLIIFDGYCYDTIIKPIVIIPLPVSSFTVTPVHPCPPPVMLTFTGSAPSGARVTWDFGDGSGGTGVSTTHNYGRRGVYDMTMTVTDATTGCVSIVRKRDTLYDLVFDIIDTPVSGCVPLTVHFWTTAMTNEPDTTLPPSPYPYGFSSYTWVYGDGSSPGSGPTPIHTYTAAGIYHAYVTAVTANGCTVSDTVEILVGVPPVVTFSATPTHVCYNRPVSFDVTIISGPVSYYYWQYGDGERRDSLLPSVHTYSVPGVFTVTLTPEYNGCKGLPVVRTLYIIVDSPKAIIHDSIFCSPPNRVQFGDSSLGDDTHLWAFGDGTTSTLDNPMHDYPALTTYTVMLATYNARSGCRDTAYRTINLEKPIPYFVADDTTVCRDAMVTFTPTVVGGTAVNYYWYVNGVYTSSTALFTHYFYTRGIYSIRLIIQDQNNCLDTFNRNGYVTVAKPIANFTATPTTGCWPLTVTYRDASTDVTGVAFSSFEWDFGDGGTTTVSVPTVTHTYVTAGSFTATEIVTDVIGCKDTVALPLVTVYRPTASFAASTTTPCSGDPVTFTNSSTGITGSFWMFGDGDTSTLNSPTHTYRAGGSYTVKLVVTDSHGCTDTAVYTGYINVSRPRASFTMDDSISICPPLMVNFTNTTLGATLFYWDLGDGTSSTVPSPSDFYTTPGYRTIMLIAINGYGCRDTAIGHVSVLGYAGAFDYSPLQGCAPLAVHFRSLVSNVPSIIWDFADGVVSSPSSIDTIVHIYTRAGAYLPKMIMSDNTGCQASSQGIDTIKVDIVTPAFTTIPNPVCLNTTITFIDSSRGYWAPITDWKWTFHNGDISTIASPTFTYTAVGTYSTNLFVTDGWGCTATITKDITVYPPPVIKACPDTTVCLTDYAVLSAEGGVSYTWADASTLSCTACNPTHATPLVITTYTVTGTDEHGCTNTDTVSVYLKYKTISKAWHDTAICRGVTVQLFDTGGTKYTWIPGTGLNSPNIWNPLAEPTATTRYMAIAQLAGCEPDTNFVMITVHQLPTVDAGPNQKLLVGSVAQLNAKGTLIDRYLWKEASTLSNDTIPNPIASMSVTTTYEVFVKSSFGCVNSDTVTISLYCDESQIFIPNTFTPNGDGQNDVFYPRGSGVSVVNSFRIYNRWGELLFERTNFDINDATSAWDGTYKGAAAKPDVYVYILHALCATGEPFFMKGDVTIVK